VKIVIEHRKSRDEQTEDILLKEYELAQNAFCDLERNVWQTAGIFVVLSIGGISLLLTLRDHNWPNFAIVVGIGLVSILVLWLWRGVIFRWWGLEDVLLYRMGEIESEVGMWMRQYIHYLDETRIFKREYMLLQGRDRVSRLDQAISNYGTAKVRFRVKVLVHILTLGWVFLVIRELILTAPAAMWSTLGNWAGNLFR